MYVEMKHIEKNYGSFHASRDVSFGIDKGKLVALLGPSGSGKTTILRMLAGLENPNSGDIFIDGRRVNDIPAAKRGIGFVFQNYALFRYMTVYDNVAFGLEIQKRPKEEIRQRVLEMIDLVGLSGMEKRYPNQLSGGQRQRVAFARALAPNPQVLLLDEPLPPSTPRSARNCATGSRIQSTASTLPASSSPTTRTKPSKWPMKSSSPTTAISNRSGRRWIFTASPGRPLWLDLSELQLSSTTATSSRDSCKSERANKPSSGRSSSRFTNTAR